MPKKKQKNKNLENVVKKNKKRLTDMTSIGTIEITVVTSSAFSKKIPMNFIKNHQIETLLTNVFPAKNIKRKYLDF